MIINRKVSIPYKCVINIRKGVRYNMNRDCKHVFQLVKYQLKQANFMYVWATKEYTNYKRNIVYKWYNTAIRPTYIYILYIILYYIYRSNGRVAQRESETQRKYRLLHIYIYVVLHIYYIY